MLLIQIWCRKPTLVFCNWSRVAIVTSYLLAIVVDMKVGVDIP